MKLECIACKQMFEPHRGKREKSILRDLYCVECRPQEKRSKHLAQRGKSIVTTNRSYHGDYAE